MELESTVKEALHALYHHPDDAVRTQADGWLQDFQHTIDAWQVADNLLHDATSNMETLMFCSQTLRSKVQRDLEELPSGAFAALRDSLIKLLKKFHKGPPRVRTQICIAVAALAVQVPIKKMGCGCIVDWINEEINSNSELLPSFLELLTVLPEEASNYKIAAHPERRRQFEKELIFSLQGVLDILTACLDLNELKEQVLEAFSSWLRVKDGVHSSTLASHRLVLSALSGLHTDPLSEASVNVISQLIQLSATGNSSDINEKMPLIQAIVPQVMCLKDQVKDPSKDVEDVKAIARLFSDIGDSYVVLIATASEESILIVGAILEVVSHPDYDIFSMTFNFWQNLALILIRRDSPVSHIHGISPQEEWERRISVFRPCYASLVSMLCFRVQYPPDDEELTSEDMKDFKETRSAAADVIHDAADVIGGEDTMKIFYHMLIEAASEWRSAEAILFCMCSVSNRVLLHESQFVPQVMTLLPALHYHPRLLETVCLTIGAYASWLKSTPGGISKLPPLVEVLLSGMRTSENTASGAALAFSQICSACGSMLFGYMEGLFQIYHLAVTRDSGLKISPRDSLHLVEALSTVISQLPLDHAKKAVEALCSPIIMPLEELVKQQDGAMDKDGSHDLTLHVDRLSNIFRYVDRPEAVAEAVHRMWPTFRLIFHQRAWDMKTMESLCRACKYAVRTSKRFIGVTIGEMLEEVKCLYQQHHQSCFLYLSSEVIKIFGSDASCAEYTRSLMEALFCHTTCLLTKLEDFTARPDIADDCFLLASRCVRYCPHLFIPSSSFPPLIDCATIGVTVMHREASNSILSFLTDVFDVRGDEVGERVGGIRDEVVGQRGASLVRVLMAALAGALPLSRVETVAGAFIALVQACGDRAVQWSVDCMALIPLVAVTQAERSRFLQSVSELGRHSFPQRALPAFQELSEVCRRNRTVEDLVLSILQSSHLTRTVI